MLLTQRSCFSRYVQLIMVGSGDEKYAQFLRGAENNNKGRVVGYVGFTPELEHKIMAGADILLMPSRYECTHMNTVVCRDDEFRTRDHGK